MAWMQHRPLPDRSAQRAHTTQTPAAIRPPSEATRDAHDSESLALMANMLLDEAETARDFELATRIQLEGIECDDAAHRGKDDRSNDSIIALESQITNIQSTLSKEKWSRSSRRSARLSQIQFELDNSEPCSKRTSASGRLIMRSLKSCRDRSTEEAVPRRTISKLQMS